MHPQSDVEWEVLELDGRAAWVRTEVASHRNQQGDLMSQEPNHLEKEISELPFSGGILMTPLVSARSQEELVASRTRATVHNLGAAFLPILRGLPLEKVNALVEELQGVPNDVPLLTAIAEADVTMNFPSWRGGSDVVGGAIVALKVFSLWVVRGEDVTRCEWLCSMWPIERVCHELKNSSPDPNLPCEVPPKPPGIPLPDGWHYMEDAEPPPRAFCEVCFYAHFDRALSQWMQRRCKGRWTGSGFAGAMASRDEVLAWKCL